MSSFVRRIPLHPNVISLLGLVFSLGAALYLSEGNRSGGLLFLILMASCDLLDGAVARQRRCASLFGAFLDSTLDRVTEGVIFLGIIAFFFRRLEMGLLLLTGAALIGSYLVSYTRARGENFIESCKVGFWERPERLSLLMLAIAVGRLRVALWFLTIGTFLTAFHRLLHLRATLQKKKLPVKSLWALLFWPYSRYSTPYFLYCLTVTLSVFIIK